MRIEQLHQSVSELAEQERTNAENERLKAIIEYIGILDYPEIFEEEEEVGQND